MTEITTVPTADLAPADLRAARALLQVVFAGAFGEDDWEHSLGGVHAIARDGGEIVGHAAVVRRQLVHRGRALHAGYVEGVGVRADHRRRGIGGMLMDAIEGVVRDTYELGALSTTDEAATFYEGRGWLRWHGPTWVLTPAGLVRTADDDDDILVLPVTTGQATAGDLACDWRDGDLW